MDDSWSPCWRSGSPVVWRCAPRAPSSRRPRRGGRAACSPTWRCNPGPHAARPAGRALLARRARRIRARQPARGADRAAAGARAGGRPPGRHARHGGARRTDLEVDARAFDAALGDGDPRAALEACSAPDPRRLRRGLGPSRRATRTRSGSPRRSSRLAAAAGDPAEAVRLTREQVALDPLAEAAQPPADRAARRPPATAPPRCRPGDQFAERLRTHARHRAVARDARAARRAPRATARPSRRRPASSARTRPSSSAAAPSSSGCARRGRGVQMHRDRRIVLDRRRARRRQDAPRPPLRRGGARRAARPSCSAAARRSRWRRSSRSPRRCARPALADALQPGGHRRRRRAPCACSTPSTPRSTDLAARAPLLLVIDDLHWADRGTLLLTSFLLRSSRPGPLLVLGTYRDTELGRAQPADRARSPSSSATARSTASGCAG